jgi:type I restriction enzyme S subunit
VHYSKQPFFVIDTAFYLKPKEDLDLHWAYYQLRTQDINGMDSGSAIPSTSRGDFYHLPVKVPPLPEQQAIAATLGALDDKIELNRRMNQTLEDLGRTLFQAWFVDFAPVRAKREGRQPEGMDSETAALFPAEFQDSPLGPIPKGWGSKTLGNIAAPIRSGVEPGDMSPETPYIGLEHMPRRSIALAEWGHAGDVGSGKSRFHAGDILFGKLRPYFHKVGVALMDGVCSTDIVVIRPQEQKWHGFILFQVSSTEFVNYTDNHSAGTKMPRTNWQDMSRYEIVQPPATIALAFNNLVQPLVARISANVAEIHTLAALRDTLLPRLLSGEMRVTEIEEKV